MVIYRFLAQLIHQCTTLFDGNIEPSVSLVPWQHFYMCVFGYSYRRVCEIHNTAMHIYASLHFQTIHKSKETKGSFFIFMIVANEAFSMKALQRHRIWSSFIQSTACCLHTVPNTHYDVIKWKHFPRYWPFVRGIHRSPVNSPHKGQWRGALMFTLICARLNGWVNNREAGDLRRHRAHYDVIGMDADMSPMGTHPITWLFAFIWELSEWVIKINGLSRVADVEVHVITPIIVMIIQSWVGCWELRNQYHLYTSMCIVHPCWM